MTAKHARLKALGTRVSARLGPRVQPHRIEDERDFGSNWQRIRTEVLLDAKGLCRCAQCRASQTLRPAAQVDHIIPVWAGGTDDPSNLQAIAIRCHALKTADEATMRVRWDGTTQHVVAMLVDRGWIAATDHRGGGKV